MDRERLKEVRQTDLTESRINQDFVDWLRTKGITWLFVVLLGVCAYLLVIRWRQHQDSHINEAWSAFLQSEQSGLPSSFVDVADEYPDVAGVGNLSLLRAGDRLLTAVQTGQALANSEGQPVALTAQERRDYLERADGIYQRIIDADDGGLSMALLVINADAGRAAVAESRGEFDAAAGFYTRAADRAERSYPRLAAMARTRAGEMSERLVVIEFPDNQDPSMQPPQLTPRQRITLDPNLRELLLPAESDRN
jgi:hypothetical protein